MEGLLEEIDISEKESQTNPAWQNDSLVEGEAQKGQVFW